jgi:hypothetical protein
MSSCYIRAIVNIWGGGNTRRWKLATAIVAALSLFIALIAGSALRPKFAAAALPDPTAWSQGTLDDDAHAGSGIGRVHLHAGSQFASHFSHASLSGSAPTDKKPFLSMWMTRGRPLTWARLSPNSLLSPLPAPFATMKVAPAGSHSAAPASAAPVDHDILTQFCVARC